jgi:Tol biopolymer transport system component
VFDPATQSSQKIADFNFIDPPLWSTDGMWLAFRVQDGNGSDEIYAVKRDGSQLTDLSANKGLPKDGQPYVMNGWLGHGMMLGGRNEVAYLVSVDDGSSRPLFDASQNKSFFSPSPDGSTLVYSYFTEYKTALKISTPDGEDVVELTAFSNASIYPVIWSLDGSQIAFAKRSNDLEDGQDVYVIERNGLNLQQVYHSRSGSVTDISFSPDGNHLLLSDHDATGQHLFVIDLETLEPKLLQIPNLPLDWWWMFPSWRP